MPNFAYTNQTVFRPFSYQEMLAPILASTQAHQALETAYSELDAQANAVGALANETNDPKTYAQYKAYESTLRTQADALAKNGLTPSSRKTLLDLRGRYSSDIVPIQNAITRRRELADEQRKALLQNPTLMFQRDMNSLSYDSSLDRFLENPDYDYGKTYSGALLTQQVSQAASNLAKELRSVSTGRLDAYTKTFLQNYGFTSKQVLDAINNPNRAQSQPVLNAIVEQVIGSSGMRNWADTDTMNSAYDYARQGLWSAIGKSNIQQFEDYGARLAAHAMASRQSGGENPLLSNAAIIPSPIYTPKELAKVRNELSDTPAPIRGLSNYLVKNEYNKFKKYFYRRPDGKMVLSNAGWREYHRKSTNVRDRIYHFLYGDTGSNLHSDFRTFVDLNLGQRGVVQDNAFGRWQAENVGAAFEKFINKYITQRPTQQDVRDASKYTQYDFPIALSDAQEWKNKILRTAVDNKFEEVKFDPKSEMFVPTSNTLDVSDLVDDKYTISNINFSGFGPNGNGNTFDVINPKGETKTYRLNPGINSIAEANLAARLDYARKLEAIPQEGGYMQDNEGNNIFITRQQAEQEHHRALQEAQFFLSQLGVVNTIKPQEYRAVGY